MRRESKCEIQCFDSGVAKDSRLLDVTRVVGSLFPDVWKEFYVFIFRVKQSKKSGLAGR